MLDEIGMDMYRRVGDVGLFMLDEIGMDMCRRVGDVGYSCLMR